METDKTWGIVLSGGGGKGSYQIGALNAVKERLPWINISMISGTSVGALNMVLYMQNKLELSEYIWKSINPSQFLDFDVEMIDFKEGLFARDALISIIDNYINLELVSNSTVNLFATASQYKVGSDKPRKKYFKLNGKKKEEIKTIILASSAMPYVYEPVIIDGVKYKDGGLVDNIPIQPLHDRGVRNLIVIVVAEDDYIDKKKYGKDELIIIKPSIPIGNLFTGTLDFHGENSAKRIQLGYEDAVRTFEKYFSESNVY